MCLSLLVHICFVSIVYDTYLLLYLLHLIIRHISSSPLAGWSVVSWLVVDEGCSSVDAMQTLIDIYRASFPAKLRFDKASQLLHAECYTLCRRHRNAKYISLSDVQRILDNYTTPGSPFVQLPIIRHLLLLRQINSIRAFFTGRQLLYNRNVAQEHRKIAHWVSSIQQRAYHPSTCSSSAATTTSTKRVTSPLCTIHPQPLPQSFLPTRPSDRVTRDCFEKEVLHCFHVATMYQRMVRLGAVLVCAIVALLCAALHTDDLLALYMHLWWHMSRNDVMAWFREVTERHAHSDALPPAYRSLLPAPCMLQRRTTPVSSSSSSAQDCSGQTVHNEQLDDALDYYVVNIVELVSEEKGVTVMAVPCPQAGTRRFYNQVGALARVCDGVLLEGVSFEQLDRIAPSYFFPLKESTFPALGLHHRYLPILGNDAEPPTLYPAGRRIHWRAYVRMLTTPFEVYCVYFPTTWSATKAEAAVAWGRLRDTIERIASERRVWGATEAKKGKGGHYVLCVPWTVHHIANMEASLIKHGFRVGRVFPVHWLARDEMGRNFCSYYHVV